MRAVFRHEQEIFSKNTFVCARAQATQCNTERCAVSTLQTKHTTDHRTVYATRYDKRHYSTSDWSSNQFACTGFLTCEVCLCRGCSFRCAHSLLLRRIKCSYTSEHPGQHFGAPQCSFAGPRSSHIRPVGLRIRMPINIAVVARTWSG